MQNYKKLLFVGLIAGFTTAASAVTIPAELIRDYPLLTAPNGLMGGPPVTINPNSVFTGAGLQFGANEGFQIQGINTNPLFPSFPTTDFSIAFDLRLLSPSYSNVTTTSTDPFGNVISSSGFPFVKLIDFKGLTVDSGLYINNDGNIEFKTLGIFGTTVIEADRDYHFAFTRESSGGLQAYLDGVSQFPLSAAASNNEGVITFDSLAFLLNDNETSDPMAAGIFSFLQIFTGTLTPLEVTGLAAQSAANRVAVPSPGSLLLMLFGVVAMRRQQLRRQSGVVATVG